MKRLVLLVVLSVFIAGVAVDAFAAEKPRVGVLRFTNHTVAAWWGRTAGTELQDMLINELASTKAFSVLERKELDKVISEQKLSESGLVDEKTRLRPGRIKVAKYLIAASVSAFEEKTAGSGGGVSFMGFSVGGKKDSAYMAIDLKVIDTETGEIADSRTVEATSEGGGMRVSGGLFGVHGNLDKYEKTPTGKAIRACIIEITEYLECSLANPDSDCMKKYAAKETKRKEKTKKAITLDE